jgi:hypothetical protein
VFTPIDKGALIRGRLGYIFKWHLFRLLAFLLAGVLSWYFNLKLTQFLITIAFCNVIFYSIEGIFNYRFSKGL